MRRSIEILDIVSQQKLDLARLGRLYTRPMEISAWIKACRQAAGLNQSELGERLGVGKANVSAWENGRHEPSYSQILKIAAQAHWSQPLPGLPSAGAWPFSGVHPDDYDRLSLEDKEEIIAMVQLKVGRLQGRNTTEKSA